VNDDERHLLAAIEVSRRAREHGNPPFGALLVDRNGRVVLEAENTVATARDCTGHAETNLMRVASARFDAEFLRGCTCYTSTEPCAMCAGALYWGDVRRVVFGLGADRLHRLIRRNPENINLPISCREIFASGEHEVDVSGPQLEQQALAVHDGYWD
jgi:tRNA(Arg) A34 adenosine deaminase TadA